MSPFLTKISAFQTFLPSDTHSSLVQLPGSFDLAKQLMKFSYWLFSFLNIGCFWSNTLDAWLRPQLGFQWLDETWTFGAADCFERNFNISNDYYWYFLNCTNYKNNFRLFQIITKEWFLSPMSIVAHLIARLVRMERGSMLWRHGWQFFLISIRTSYIQFCAFVN